MQYIERVCRENICYIAHITIWGPDGAWLKWVGRALLYYDDQLFISSDRHLNWQW